MTLRILPLLGLLLISFSVSAFEPATTWDPFMEIPRASEVQNAMAASRGVVRAPRARAVRWDLEQRRGFVRAGSEWMVIDLDRCTLLQGDDLPTPPRAKPTEEDASSRRGGGGRGDGLGAGGSLHVFTIVSRIAVSEQKSRPARYAV